MPAIVLATEPFAKLVKVTLGADKAPEALAVVMRGNPDFLEEQKLTDLAHKAFDEAVRRLTSGTGSCDEIII